MASQMAVNMFLLPSWCLVIATQFEITGEDVGILRHNGKFEYES
jgi:hypothetical protein